MSSDWCLLITVLYENELMRCALKIPNDKLRLSGPFYWQEHRDTLSNLLPLHVRESGPIVDVEEIFEVKVI